MLCQFETEVTRDEKVHSVQVIVYHTVESLREAAQSYYASTGADETLAPDVRAVTHSFHSISVRPGARDVYGRRVCIVRIPKEAGAAIVGHELLHAACQLYRTFFRDDISLGDACGDAEEDLAYLFSDLMYDVGTQLKRQGVW